MFACVRRAAGLAFCRGERHACARAVELIVEQPNDFHRALARGVEHAAAVAAIQT